ncbi:glycosyl transferase family protein [Sphingomonas jatrophae]|uniref:Adsorption protein B n=1 Tax=Sphingomonas jatrophae TaxID=1166337 RepID=A0A1I6LRK5_9SPHN|nr:glycosyl transferase family protein [Sphingomonas jatrophae]SFS06063.1 adsorption protein B [Sphingomonas jatrophae]
MTELIWLTDALARELLLFAAAGLLIGGVDDLAVDLIFFARRGWKQIRVNWPGRRAHVGTLTLPDVAPHIAIFVGAWDEAGVIGKMVKHARRRWGDADYRLYIGVYPNDYATLWELHADFALDPKVRIVHGDRNGPTSKSEALNRCYAAMLEEEARGGPVASIVAIHDAEDQVHRDELTVFSALVGRFDIVQLPVLPLSGASWVSRHYADEFGESHTKTLLVRELVGAGVPLAGTGCALSRAALDEMARLHGGSPFDEGSVTEDYELGLRMGDLGARAAFVRMLVRPEDRKHRNEDNFVAVRAHFPATFGEAVRQKARWIDGIAFAGWDRLGWAGGPAEAWMRLRDRRAPLAALVLTAGYAGALMGLLATLLRLAAGEPAIMLWRPDALGIALTLLLGWRVGMRVLFVSRIYGAKEGLWSMPRLVVANFVLIASSWRALRRYLSPHPPQWDKTAHVFPATLPAE